MDWRLGLMLVNPNGGADGKYFIPGVELGSGEVGGGR